MYATSFDKVPVSWRRRSRHPCSVLRPGRAPVDSRRNGQHAFDHRPSGCGRPDLLFRPTASFSPRSSDVSVQAAVWDYHCFSAPGSAMGTVDAANRPYIRHARSRLHLLPPSSGTRVARQCSDRRDQPGCAQTSVSPGHRSRCHADRYRAPHGCSCPVLRRAVPTRPDRSLWALVYDSMFAAGYSRRLRLPSVQTGMLSR